VIGRLLGYLRQPVDVSDFERAHLARMNRIALVFFGLHVPILMLVAGTCGTGVLKAAILGSLVLIGPIAGHRTLENPRNVTKVFGVTATCMGGLLVHFGQGPMQIAMHFYFFVLLALLACFVARSFFDSVIGLEVIMRRRTEQLAASAVHLRLMLNNAGQGFLTFDATGTLSPERSAVLHEWLGVPEPSMRVWDYLRLKDAKVADAFELGWSAVVDDVLPLDLTLDQMPKRMLSEGRVLELLYKPIFDCFAGGKLHQVLLVVSDRTDQVERERFEAENREIRGVLDRVLTDREGFVEFLSEASGIVSSLVSPPPRIEDVRRIVHTLKGNCAVFGLARIATTCHALEERIAGANVTARPSDTADLVLQWKQLMSRLAGVLGNNVRGHIEVSEAEYVGVLRALSLKIPRRDIVQEMESWRLEPTERRLNRMADQARSVADRLHKNVCLQLESNGVRVGRTELAGFWSALVHVVRNAVDHGIETEEERVLAGKPAFGTLRLKTALEGPDLVFRAEDDGRGIDWARVRERAQEMGLRSATDEDLNEALLASGFSTTDAATEHSGRGVGLHAVSTICRELGGRIRIRSAKGRGACVEIRIPRSRASGRESTKMALLSASRSERGSVRVASI
jgi:two-component system, chemotaxis family, sensor kinase CheA